MGKAKQAVAARPVVDPAVFRRRRRNLAIVGGAIVLLVALLTAFIAPGWAWMDRDAAVESVQPPTPAPRIGEQTALVQVVPDVVEPLAQQAIVNFHPWQGEAGALEAWQFTYAPAAAAADSPVEVLLTVGQWQTPETAAEFLEAAANTGRRLSGGDVSVGGRTAGRFYLLAIEDGYELWWRNATVVFRAEGARGTLEAFFAGFPM